MKVQISNNNIKLWLSADDTYDWAHKSNGRDGIDIPSDEFNAITSDSLRLKLHGGHPCYFVAVGQHQ